MKHTFCVFKIGTANVELRFDDETEISIYTLGVDDEIFPTIPMQAEID